MERGVTADISSGPIAPRGECAIADQVAVLDPRARAGGAATGLAQDADALDKLQSRFSADVVAVMSSDTRAIERWLSNEDDGLALPPRLASELQQAGQLRVLAGGTRLSRSTTGDETSVHLLYEGLAKLVLAGERRPVTLSVLHRGALVGDLHLLIGNPRNVEMQAVSDVTLLSIPSPRFLELVRVSPQLTRAWLDSLAGRVRTLQDRLGETLAGTLDQRIAVTLLDQMDHEQVFRYSQTLLAELLGVQRSSVSRVLSQFQREGLVDVAYRRVTVLTPAGLAEIAADSHRPTSQQEP